MYTRHSRRYLYLPADAFGPFPWMQAGQVLGGSEYVTVAELVQTVIDVSGKEIGIEYVEGPVGVHSRNLDKSRSRALGWEAKTSLKEGIAETYAWIEAQADAARIAESADSE